MLRHLIVAISLLIAMPIFTDNDPSRRTDLIAADLNILEQVFIDCFMDVQPDGAKAPSGARPRMNRDILLSCLQSSNREITNTMLDSVMDAHRPEGPIRN